MTVEVLLAMLDSDTERELARRLVDKSWKTTQFCVYLKKLRCYVSLFKIFRRPKRWLQLELLQ